MDFLTGLNTLERMIRDKNNRLYDDKMVAEEETLRETCGMLHEVLMPILLRISDERNHGIMIIPPDYTYITHDHDTDLEYVHQKTYNDIVKKTTTYYKPIAPKKRNRRNYPRKYKPSQYKKIRYKRQRSKKCYC